MDKIWVEGCEMTHIPIQRRRTRGFKHPPGTLFVDRTGIFGNPYKIRFCGVDYHVELNGNTVGGVYGFEQDARKAAVELFRQHLANMKIYKPAVFTAMLERVRAAPYIACYCPVGSPCHRDVWIELAAETEPLYPKREAA